MNNIITGICRITETRAEDIFPHLNIRAGEIRFMHDLEKLTVAAVGDLLLDAAIALPVQNADISMYITIDNAVENIKDLFWGNIRKDGPLGASPLLFPLTAPNALTAQASIAFDIRGENIVFAGGRSLREAIDYADACISHGHTKMAVAGSITTTKREDCLYEAELFFMESPAGAEKRGARAYRDLPEAIA